MPEKSNPLAVAALVLGISGILLWFIFVPQLLALIFGIISYTKSFKQGRKGFALVGIILGAVGIVITPIFMIFSPIFVTILVNLLGPL